MWSMGIEGQTLSVSYWVSEAPTDDWNIVWGGLLLANSLIFAIVFILQSPCNFPFYF